MNYCIYSEKEECTEGMFGQILVWLLEILNDLEKSRRDINISFNINALAYGKLIPKFIIPKVTVPITDDTVMINVKKYKMAKKIDFPFNIRSFEIANYLWNKYFTFSKEIYEKIPEIDEKTTLGVHYRGTDKNVDMSQANPITQDEFITIIKDFLSNNNNITTLYCCSDESSFIDNVRKSFTNVNIIEYKQLRSHNTTNAFFRTGYVIDKNLQDELTINALVDMISLSKCNSIIKTSSALSCFSKIINQNVKVYSVSAMKERWFPTALVETYKSDSQEVLSILKRTMYGNVYEM